MTGSPWPSRMVPEFVELLLAITTVGAAAAPLNPGYTHDEFQFYLDDLEPAMILLPSGAIGAGRSAAGPDRPVIDVALGQDGPPLLSMGGRSIDQARPFESGQVEDIALVLHTSGTTSRPKQVPLLQRNLTSSAVTIASHYHLDGDDVSFCAMPLFHVHGLVASTLATLMSGGLALIPRRLNPSLFWTQARQHGVTWVSAGPTLHQMLLDKIDDAGDPGRLRFVRSCSSALSTSLMQRAEALYQAPMLEAYGMTEASHQITSNPLPPGARPPGSVGIATGTEIAIADQDGRLRPEGTEGEVVIKGAGLTQGYLNNPEANREAFVGGWFRTGDIGILQDNYLRLVGRRKEMILRGGENISPTEIEEVLRKHPAVVDAGCFGVEDEKYGETVAAAVVLAETVDERELVRHCRVSLAAYKVPEKIHVLPALPRTPTGKLQRRRIPDEINRRART